FYRLLKDEAQFYLLGPNIRRIPDGVERAFRCSFHDTNFATVAVEQHRVRIDGNDEMGTLVELVRSLNEPTLIFCRSPQRVEEVVEALLDAGLGRPSPAMQ